MCRVSYPEHTYHRKILLLPPKNVNIIILLITKEIKMIISTTKAQHFQNANKLPLVVSPYCQRPTTVTIAGVSYLEKDSVKDFFEILEEVML